MVEKLDKSEDAQIERDLKILAEIAVDAFLESQKAKRRAIIEQQAPQTESTG